MEKHLSCALICTASLLAASVPSVVADPIYAQSNTVLMADNDLVSYRTDSEESFVLASGIGATDVTVVGCAAIVTTGESGSKAFEKIDLTDALDSGEIDPAFCAKCGEVTFDPEENVLSVPCVEAFGKVWTVDMKRRGASDNWAIDFLEEVKDEQEKEQEFEGD